MNIEIEDIAGKSTTISIETLVSKMTPEHILIILYNFLLNNGSTTPIVRGIQVGRVLAKSKDATTANLILDFLVGFVDTVGHMANSKYAKALNKAVRTLFS